MSATVQGTTELAAPASPGTRRAAAEPAAPTSPGLAAVLRRELARMRGRPIYLLLMLVLPLAGWFLLLAAFSQRVPRDLPVAVVDEDRSLLSREAARAIDATPTIRVVERDLDLASARQALERGDVYAVLVLPRDLQRDAARGAARPVQAFYNNQWLLVGGLVSKDVRTAVGTLSARLDARGRVARGESPATAVVSAEPIRTELHPLFNPALDYAAFLFLALVPTLLQMFVLMVSVQAIGSELKQGTAAAWLDAAGGNAPVALAGKLGPHALWFLALGVALTELSARWLGLPVAGSRAALYGALALFVLAYQTIGVLLVSATADVRLATTASGLLAAPAFAVAGVSFPVSAMSAAGKVWASILPLTHYLRIQTQQLLDGAPIMASVRSLVALVAFVVLPMLAIPRLDRLARAADRGAP